MNTHLCAFSFAFKSIRILRLLGLGAAALLLPALAWSELLPPSSLPEQSTLPAIDTLQRIRDTGTVNISYRVANLPFTYLDSSQRPTGYAKELCDRVVDTLKTELKLPQLTIHYVEVAAKNRLQSLRDGTVDLNCGSTSDTPERRKDADFSIPYFITNIRILTRRDYDFSDVKDMAGKAIVITAGSNEKVIQEKIDFQGLRIKLLHGDTHAASFMMVRTGRAVAYITDDVLLAGTIANSRDPQAYEIIGPTLSTDRYAIMMRKGDDQLKAMVNSTLADLMASGEIIQLYNRWFMSPIPPSGINLNLPINPELKHLFAHPPIQ
jgi:glutamate/aspartate transport system substrate-binding protein